MESTGDDWKSEMKKNIRPIGNISGTELKSIKRDRIQNHSTFEDSFKDFVLKWTSER